MQVQLELPGEVPEVEKETTSRNTTKETSATPMREAATNMEPRRVNLISVKKVCDEMIGGSGVGNTPDMEKSSTRAKVEHMTLGGVETTTAITEIRTIEPEVVGRETTAIGKTELERKRMMRDINVATAMREHLATINPELDTTMAFLGSVCGRPTVRRNDIRETAAAGIATAAIKVAMDVETTTFTTTSHEEQIPENTSPTKVIASVNPKGEVNRDRDVESDSDRDEDTVVVLDDTDMSESESTGEESRSRSSFGGSSSDLGHSRANRKRAAEDSPDRDYDPSARPEFPGVVSRGKSGCRIYVPTRGTIETGAKKMTSVTAKPDMPEGTAIESGVTNDANLTVTEMAGTSANRDGQAEDRVNVEPVLSQSVTTDVTMRETTRMKEIKIRDQIGARILVGGAKPNPFVAVNAVVNVPVQLLPIANTRAIVNINTGADVGENIPQIMTTGPTINVATAHATTPINIWGQHGKVVSEVYKVLAGMEPPWGSFGVYKEMARRFPEIEPTALQMTVLAVLMTQRQCVRDITLAGARRGPRRDENGQIFMELDLEYAHRYSDSY